MTADRYRIVFDRFWDDPAPRIAELGGCDAVALAFYLQTNVNATMIGLYPVDLQLLKDQLPGLTQRRTAQALRALELVDFAKYDALTRFVWVCEMAKDQLQLQAKPLALSDNRTKAVHRLYASARPNPFLSPFFDRYEVDLHLPQRRTFTGERQSMLEGLDQPARGDVKPLRRSSEGTSKPLNKELVSPSKGASKELERGFEAPSKPEIRDQQDLVQGSGDQENPDQVVQRATSARHIRKEAEDYAVIEKLVHTVLDEQGEALDDDGGLAEEVKTRASRFGLTYFTSATIHKAIDSARVQRLRRRMA